MIYVLGISQIRIDEARAVDAVKNTKNWSDYIRDFDDRTINLLPYLQYLEK